MLPAPEHITIAYDGSALSELALHDCMRQMQHGAYSMVHVVCVAEKRGPMVQLPTGEVLTPWGALETLRQVVGILAKNWKFTHPMIRLVVHLRTADPSSESIAKAVVDLAYRYHTDKISVGMHGTLESHKNRVGSVAKEILQLSDLPVSLKTPLSPHLGQKINLMRWAYVFGGSALRHNKLLQGSTSYASA